MVNHHSEHDESYRFHREDYPFHWVVTVNARYNQMMEVELKKIDLDVSRFRILSLSRDFGVASITKISEYAIIKMPTVVKIVSRLKEEGLLATNPSEKDKRVTLISLTDEGIAVVDNAMIRVQQVFEKAFEGISTRQMERMNLILAMILENMND